METKVYNNNNNNLLNYYDRLIVLNNKPNIDNNNISTKLNKNSKLNNDLNSSLNSGNNNDCNKINGDEDLVDLEHSNKENDNQDVPSSCIDNLKKRRWQRSLSQEQMSNYNKITSFNHLFNFDAMPCGCLLCEKVIEFPAKTDYKTILMFVINSLVEFKKQKINSSTTLTNSTVSTNSIGLTNSAESTNSITTTNNNNSNNNIYNLATSNNEVHEFVHLIHIKEYIELHRSLLNLTPNKKENYVINSTLNEFKILFKSGFKIFGARGYYKLSTTSDLYKFLDKYKVNEDKNNGIYDNQISSINNSIGSNKSSKIVGSGDKLQIDVIGDGCNRSFNKVNFNNKKRRFQSNQELLYVPNIDDEYKKIKITKNNNSSKDKVITTQSNINVLIINNNNNNNVNNNNNNNNNNHNNNNNNVNNYNNNNSNNNNIDNNNSNNNNQFINYQNLNNGNRLVRSFSINSILNDYF